ncbi:fumarate reductase subunit FrdD [Saccharopolyspora shandongensis]|uniref:fumarate reductase subunit FrdD n=1 Tax=Saccharopolyspora shandongensis TaxID=418495 RepID=UPI0033FDD79F
MADRRSPEPLAWLLFSIGGTVAALLVPVLLVLFGIAFPTGLLPAPDHAHLLAVLRHPATKVVLLGLCVALLFHWAHRFRYTLYDGLQLKRLGRPITTFCYGAAALGSIAAAYVLISA